VVVPAHNGAHVLARSLPALLASDLPRRDWELIVVDDASTDETSRTARAYADAVFVLDGIPHGPAFARNRGSESAHGDILVFVDADVCVRPDVLRRFRDALDGDPDACAVFGAYDTEPDAPGLVSQYRNLLHHRVHAEHAGDADTFWAGCGAIRRSAFARAGGFDAGRYPRPQIEDIELGYRLRAHGCRITLRPEIQGTHLKRWTLRGMVLNDVRDRGIPWMRLLLAGDAVGSGTLNVRAGERVMTVAAALALLALLVAPFAVGRVLIGFAAVCVLVILALDMPLFRWFARVRGNRFALRIVPLRLLYYVLNAIAGSIAVAQHVGAMLSGRTTTATSADGSRRDREETATTDRTVRGRAP
jgi:cellulose synthase/poly-beta-1,6-N-acetylglucosamine synthase-like glycosyltransferase